MIRATWRTFFIMLTVLVTSITCGCSVLIIKSGVSGPEALSNPKTRAEVREQFGKPDDTRTCPDGRVVESRWIRQQLKAGPPTPNQSINLGPGAGELLLYLAALDLVLYDIPGTALAAYISEKRKLHYAFVYDEEDRVLYRYDLAAPTAKQFEEATRFLDGFLYSQLEARNCETWTACITDYVYEIRQRPTCLGYTLAVDQEQAFERMFTIGEGVDSGRIPREDGLAEIKERLYVSPL